MKNNAGGETGFLETAHALLERLVTERWSGTAAHQAVRDLGAQHPALNLELIERPLQIDGSTEFDLLVSGLGATTLSLTASAPDAAPWPLRGYQRWTNDQLGRVDGMAITTADALVGLECLGEDLDLIGRLVDAAIVKRELLLRPMQVTDAQVQESADGLRRRLRLFTAAAARAWLAARGLSENAFATQAREAAVLQALRRRLVGEAAPGFFTENRDLFAEVDLIVFGSKTAAVVGQLAERLRAGSAPFGAAQAVAADVTIQFLNGKRIFELHPAQAALARGAPAEQILGPCQAGATFQVMQITALRPVLGWDERQRSAVEDALFAHWLAERRANASIEWFWGTEKLVSRIREANKGPLNIWMTRPDRRDPPR